jgi:DNA-binding MarR family transcriptional regulator
VQPSSPSKDLVAVTPRELGRQLAGFFLWITNSSNHDFLPRITELELTLTQMKALFQLTVVDELALKEIADGLGLSDAATSRAVDGLVKRELVERSEDAADRRIKRVCLTKRGRKMIDELAAVRIATFQRLVEELPDDERTKLADALEPILARHDLGRFNPRSRR